VLGFANMTVLSHLCGWKGEGIVIPGGGGVQSEGPT